MGTYELWRNVMYCVGVFVTCNAGGAGLRLAASALRRRHAPPDAPPERGQSFADMMREVDAHQGDYPPDPPGEPGEPGPPVTPEELAEAYRRTAPAPDAA